MLPIVQPPSDSFLPFEKLFLKDIMVSIYRNIRNSKTKFIIVSYFECGYSQDQIAKMIDVSQVTVCKRIKKTQEKLRNSYLFKSLYG